MTLSKNVTSIICFFLIVLVTIPAFAQKKGTKSITKEELYTHLKFIASDEMAGRDTPSKELKLAARYLATMVESYGFKPILPDGSFMQKIPVDITLISEAKSRVILADNLGERVISFRKGFGTSSRTNAYVSGDVVFAGYGLSIPDMDWDDYAGLDVKDKIVVLLDGVLPEGHRLKSQENMRNLYMRGSLPGRKGAAAVINVISPEREKKYEEQGLLFDNPERGSFPFLEEIGGNRRGRGNGRVQIDVRHDVAVAILGISRDELDGMFLRLADGNRVNGFAVDNSNISINIATEKRKGFTQNVVAYLEGSDKKLKDEYVVFGSHYDHVGTRNGEVYNGADDDGSGTVAMLELAQAYKIERPKRSLIFVWHTGEEKGLVGAKYFVLNSPVPHANISAMLQMDMLTRNDPESIFIIGSHFHSSELDKINRNVEKKKKYIKLDDEYNDPEKPRNYFRNSDHHAYATMAGIPVTFYFCGVHEDLHSPTDDVENCDFDKFENVVKHIYNVGMQIGNYKHLLKLDRDEAVTSRGLHNMKNSGRR